MSDIRFVRGNIKSLAILGLWQYGEIKNPCLKILFNIFGKFVFFYFVCFNLSEYIDMYHIGFDILPLMGNAAVSLLYAVTVLKAYTIHFRKDRIEKLLAEIRRSENNAKEKHWDEQEIYEESVKQNMFVSKLFWYVCASTIGMFYVARPAEYYLLGPDEIHGCKVPLVFSSWFPFDKFAPGYYEIAYTLQVIAGLIGAAYTAVIDVFLVSFLIFSLGQFRIQQYCIRNLHLQAELCSKDNKDLVDVYEYVVQIIKEHNIIIDFIADVDDMINPIVFANFLTCSLLICAVGLEGIMAGPSPRLGLNVYYLCAILTQLFIFYWHANEVSLESMNIGRAVTESQWYNFSARAKQALLMMVVRSQKPCTLSVGGFYIMSLNTFLMILRTTYSFLALFRKVYARQNEGSH